MRLPILLTVAFLAGCAGQPSLPTVTKIPVPVPCISEAPKSPVFATDAELLKLGDYDFVVTLAKERKERQGYESLMEAAISGCL